MNLPIFTTTGTNKKDYHLLNGSPDFSKIPAGVIRGIDQTMPIRLPYGDRKFGANHIMHSHGKWVKDNEPSGCVATFVWRKLSENGMIYSEVELKINISLRISPSALIVLKQQDGFYSITTMYSFPRNPNGQRISKYYGLWINNQK